MQMSAEWSPPVVDVSGHYARIKYGAGHPEIVASDPLSLMAAWYRRQWKHLRDLRRIRKSAAIDDRPPRPSFPPMSQEERERHEAMSEVMRLRHVTIAALRGGPYLQPSYATRWGIGGGVPIVPDHDGVGSWGKIVRAYEDVANDA